MKGWIYYINILIYNILNVDQWNIRKAKKTDLASFPSYAVLLLPSLAVSRVLSVVGRGLTAHRCADSFKIGGLLWALHFHIGKKLPWFTQQRLWVNPLGYKYQKQSTLRLLKARSWPLKGQEILFRTFWLNQLASIHSSRMVNKISLKLKRSRNIKKMITFSLL